MPYKTVEFFSITWIVYHHCDHQRIRCRLKRWIKFDKKDSPSISLISTCYRDFTYIMLYLWRRMSPWSWDTWVRLIINNHCCPIQQILFFDIFQFSTLANTKSGIECPLGKRHELHVFGPFQYLLFAAHEKLNKSWTVRLPCRPKNPFAFHLRQVISKIYWITQNAVLNCCLYKVVSLSMKIKDMLDNSRKMNSYHCDCFKNWQF